MGGRDRSGGEGGDCRETFHNLNYKMDLCTLCLWFKIVYNYIFIMHRIQLLYTVVEQTLRVRVCILFVIDGSINFENIRNNLQIYLIL
jgi:hypothetical protein